MDTVQKIVTSSGECTGKLFLNKTSPTVSTDHQTDSEEFDEEEEEEEEEEVEEDVSDEDDDVDRT